MQGLGYSIITDPDVSPIERDAITCKHCQRIVHIKPGSGYTTYLLPPPQGSPLRTPWREEPGAMCARCHAPICLACYADGRCRPWERQLERMEARDRLRRAVGV